MSASEYLLILKKLLLKNRHVVAERDYFKIYLPKEYNDIWKYIHENKIRVDIIIILPYTINNVDKLLIMNKLISKQHIQYKIYLPKTYNPIWHKLSAEKQKVDLIIVFKV